MIAALIVALLAFVSFPAHAETVHVIDGDGLRINGQTVRLWGIDAPELRQTCQQGGKGYACGELARDALQRAVGGSLPRCEAVSTDRYGRTVARCFVAGRDLAAVMVADGWAVDWPRYSRGAYASMQDTAQAAKRGQWAGFFVAPWEWRKR